jgi:hypothetical protein
MIAIREPHVTLTKYGEFSVKGRGPLLHAILRRCQGPAVGTARKNRRWVESAAASLQSGGPMSRGRGDSAPEQLNEGYRRGTGGTGGWSEAKRTGANLPGPPSTESDLVGRSQEACADLGHEAPLRSRRSQRSALWFTLR